MGVKLIRNGAWVRILIDGRADIPNAERITGIRLEPVFDSRPDAPIVMRIAQARLNELEISDMIIIIHERGVVTIEPRDTLTFLDDLDERLRCRHLDQEDRD